MLVHIAYHISSQSFIITRHPMTHAEGWREHTLEMDVTEVASEGSRIRVARRFRDVYLNGQQAVCLPCLRGHA